MRNGIFVLSGFNATSFTMRLWLEKKENWDRIGSEMKNYFRQCLHYIKHFHVQKTSELDRFIHSQYCSSRSDQWTFFEDHIFVCWSEFNLLWIQFRNHVLIFLVAQFYFGRNFVQLLCCDVSRNSDFNFAATCHRLKFFELWKVEKVETFGCCVNKINGFCCRLLVGYNDNFYYLSPLDGSSKKFFLHDGRTGSKNVLFSDKLITKQLF